MSDLLPCPFCGGTAELLQIGNEVTPKRGFEVKCETWGCRTTKRAMVIRQPLEKARGFAIASWNTRAPTEARGYEIEDIVQMRDGTKAGLKPCPICGSPAKLVRLISPEGEARGDTPSFDVDCVDCWVHGRWESEAEAVAAWNRRPSSPPARSDQAVSDVRSVRDWLNELRDLNLEDVVADGGVTASMVVQQQARDMAARLSRVLTKAEADHG